MDIPYIASDWKILFKPEKNGIYVNDHSVVKGPDGAWHLYGITSFTGSPTDERYFVHGAGKSLECRFDEWGRSIDRGTLAWAPGVIEKDGIYYMFYGPSPTMLAVSPDMFEWFGATVTLRNEPIMAAHRDHFVLRLDDGSYLMYVVGLHDKKGAVSCFSSTDLITWDFCGFALTSGDDAPLKPAWGAVESPFVVKRNGLYYLFVTYTDSIHDETYNDTLVFCSSDPKSFGQYNGGTGGALPITKICAHAPEILEENGNFYITTCGWCQKPTPHKGAVSIARLEWKSE